MLTKPHALIVANMATALLNQVNGVTINVNKALTEGVKKTPMNGLDTDITAEELRAAFGTENVAKVEAALNALAGG